MERTRLRALVQIIQTHTAPMLSDAVTSDVQLQEEKLLELQAVAG